MWELTRFGNDASIIVPKGKVKGSFGTFDTVDTIMQVAGGTPYDTYGRDIAPSQPGTIQQVAHLHDNTPAALENTYRALSGKRGHVERLFRTWHTTQLSEWVYARLKSVSAPHDTAFSGRNLLKSLTCTWSVLSPQWNGTRHGAGWDFNSGEYFNSGLNFNEDIFSVFQLENPTTWITITNSGNVAAQEIRLVITPNGSDITALTITKFVPGLGNTVMFYMTIPIYSGNALHINLANKSLTYDGLTHADYNLFHLGAANPYEQWLLIEPGENIFSVQRTGGLAESTISFNFYDGWA